MKVLPINNYYAYQNRSTNKNHTSVAAQQINFTSLWNSSKELTLQEKFEYGLEALGDEKSVLFVTNYRESAEYILKTEGKDLIDIPVENLYTMEFPKKDGDSNTSFVIFKKNNQYHFINLNNIFTIKVFNPNKKASADVSDYVKRDTVRILKDGDAIFKKDSVMEKVKKEDFFAFKTPKSTSNANAKKCLEYISFSK